MSEIKIKIIKGKKIRIPFLTRLLEIKEEQLKIEYAKIKYLHDIREILSTTQQEQRMSNPVFSMIDGIMKRALDKKKVKKRK